MRRHLRLAAIWILLLTLLGAAYAQPAAPPKPGSQPASQAASQSASQSAPQPRRFLMWKASSPTATVYLVGSIHLGDSSFYPLPPEVEAAFAAAKTLAVEFDVRKMDQATALKLIQQYGTYPAGDLLANHVPKETSAALDHFCAAHSFPCERFAQMKPWLVGMVVSVLPWMEAGEQPKLGVDIHFLNETDGAKTAKHIDELESSDFQMQLFVHLSDEEQLALLTSALKNGDSARQKMKQLQAAYSSGDADALQKIMDEDTTSSPSLNQKLLYDRNISMAARVDDYLKGKDPVFVVVGAAHLVGPKGVAQLLRDKGYKVEQVTLQAN